MGIQKKILLVFISFFITATVMAQQNILAQPDVTIITSDAAAGGSLYALNDGNIYSGDTWWNSWSLGDSLWIQFKLPAAKVAGAYQMYFWGGAASYGARTTLLYASQDGSNWDILASKSANADPVEASLSNTQAYTYYRFVFKDYVSSSYLDFYEIRLFDNSVSAPALSAAPGTVGHVVNLSWNATLLGSGDYSLYELQRSADGINFSAIANIPSPATDYSDSTLTQVTTYWYRIRARKDTIFSAFSNTVKTTTISDTLKGAPILFTSARKGNEILLFWDYTINTPGSFELYRSADSINYSLHATLDKSLSSYTDTLPDTTVAYYYKIRGINYTSASLYSNVAKVTDKLTDAPTITSIVPGSIGTQATITWSYQDITAPDYRYSLERSTDSTNFIPIQVLDQSSTSYADTTLADDSKYYYRIKAFNYLSVSPYSSIASVTTVNDTLKNIPTLTATASIGTQAQLSWAYTFNSPAPGGFDIEQSADSVHFISLGKVGESTRDFTIQSLEPDTDYWFRIRAYNYTSHSLYSNIVKVTTNDITGFPADITDDGGKLYVSAENNSGGLSSPDNPEGSSHLIDNSLTSKFLVFQGQDPNGMLDCIYKPSDAYLVSSYSLGTGNDAASYPGRNPRNWTFSGSDDSTNWTILDTQTNQWGSTPSSVLYHFTIANPGKVAFKYYKIAFTANNYSTDGVAYQIGEWEIFGVPASTPSLPNNLTVTDSSENAISLSWQADVSDTNKVISKFILQRGIDGLHLTTINDSIPADARTYTDEGLTDSTRYYYRIQAVGNTNVTVSGYSNLASAYTTYKTGQPHDPANLTILSATDNTMTLQWMDRSYNETGFEIQRSTDSVTFTTIDTLEANTSTYIDTVDLWPATQYYYRILAYNESDSSHYSNIASRFTTGYNRAPSASIPVIPRNICTGKGSFTFSMGGIIPGPDNEKTQLVRVTAISTDSTDSSYFSAFNFDSTYVTDGIIRYGFTSSGTAQVGDSAIIYITVKDNGGTLYAGTDSTVIPVFVNFVPFSVAITADKPLSAHGDSVYASRNALVTLTAHTTAPENVSYRWEHVNGMNSGIEGSDTLILLHVRPIGVESYKVTATTEQGCTATATITVNPNPQNQLVIANVMTPNGDGINDRWIIWGLSNSNAVYVFDRSGRTVYYKQNYSNDWGGMYKGSLLPEGTYYYMVKTGANEKSITGILTIIRNRK